MQRHKPPSMAILLQFDFFSGGASNPSSNFSTPYNTINRPKDGQGYDDTTLQSRNRGAYPPNSHMAGSDPRLYQGHSNPALAQEQPGMSLTQRFSCPNLAAEFELTPKV